MDKINRHDDEEPTAAETFEKLLRDAHSPEVQKALKADEAFLTKKAYDLMAHKRHELPLEVMRRIHQALIWEWMKS